MFNKKKVVDGINNKLSDVANKKEAQFEDGTKQYKTVMETIKEYTDGALKTVSGLGIGKTESIPDNIIAVTSASGGAGATTLVVNIAEMLRRAGKTVLIIDADILNPNVYHYIEYEAEKNGERVDMVSYLMGDCVMGDCICNKSPISIMSAKGRMLTEYVTVDEEKPAENLASTVYRLRELFDIVLIDLPTNPVCSQLANALMHASDKIVMVWDESVQCVSNTEAFRVNLSLSGISEAKIDSIIINKKTSVYYSDAPLKKLGVEVRCVLPFDIGIIESGLRGEIFVEKGVATSRYSNVFCKELQEFIDGLLERCSSKGVEADTTQLEAEMKKLKAQTATVAEVRENMDELLETLIGNLNEESNGNGESEDNV